MQLQIYVIFHDIREIFLSFKFALYINQNISVSARLNVYSKKTLSKEGALPHEQMKVEVAQI